MRRLETSAIKIVIVGTGNEALAKSAIVITDKFRYAINCSENSYRILSGLSLSVNKIENLFITHNSWSNYSGIIGIFLDDQLSPTKSLTIHGPSAAFATLEFLLPMFDSSHNISRQESTILSKPHEDDNFTVEALSFLPKGEDSDSEANSKQRNMSVAYHFKPHKLKLQIDMKKCEEMQLPKSVLKSNLMRRITLGESVELEDGRVISPEDVTNKREDAPSFMFVENVSAGHVQSMLASQRLKALLSASPPALVVHFTDEAIQRLPEHNQLLRLFPSSCNHLFADGRSEPSPLVTVSKNQGILHYFCNRRTFPLLSFQNKELSEGDGSCLPSLTDEDWMKVDSAVSSKMEFALRGPSASLKVSSLMKTAEPFENFREAIKNEIVQSSSAYSAIPMLSYDIQPHHGWSTEFVFNTSVVDAIAAEFVRNRFFGLQDIQTLMDEAGKRIQTSIKDGKLSAKYSKYPLIVFLGTGASAPTIHRNVPGILVRCSDTSSILLDCGEGTLAQLYTFYGRDKVLEILKTIDLICITHRHLDHILGLISLIQARDRLLRANGKIRPIHILAPPSIKKNLSFHKKTFGDNTLPPYEFHQINFKGPPTNENMQFSDVVKALEFVTIDAVSVQHIYNSYGFVLRHKGGWSVTYSGDTRPSENLIKAGSECDLLIHEATFETGMNADAQRKKHSTVEEAIDVGNRMRAKFIMLTHFSQRYAGSYWLLDVPENVAFATDMMQITLEDCPYLSYTKDVAQAIFFSSEQRHRRPKRKLKHDTSNDVPAKLFEKLPN